MSAHTKQAHSSLRYSLSISSDVPMSVFNPQVLEEASKHSGTRDRTSSRQGHRPIESKSNKRYSQTHHRRSTSVAVSRNSSAQPVRGQERLTRIMGDRDPPSSKHRSNEYIRPKGPELVSAKHPSCSGLPPAWDEVHDRLIAYLATHAPLDGKGKVPRQEEKEERWKTEDIAKEVMQRFPLLQSPIRVPMIETRLTLLDQAGNNDYFKMPYGAYKYEEWGAGI